MYLNLPNSSLYVSESKNGYEMTPKRGCMKGEIHYTACKIH